MPSLLEMIQSGALPTPASLNPLLGQVNQAAQVHLQEAAKFTGGLNAALPGERVNVQALAAPAAPPPSSPLEAATQAAQQVVMAPTAAAQQSLSNLVAPNPGAARAVGGLFGRYVGSGAAKRAVGAAMNAPLRASGTPTGPAPGTAAWGMSHGVALPKKNIVLSPPMPGMPVVNTATLAAQVLAPSAKWNPADENLDPSEPIEGYGTPLL